MAAHGGYAPGNEQAFNTESYDKIDEHDFRKVARAPMSTFSIDVDTASYSNVRRFLRTKQLPPIDAVRIEELVNYFRYDDAPPTGDEPVAVNTELSAAPWKEGHQLLRIGIRAKDIAPAQVPARNLVFLLDVSGSMAMPDKLPLLKQAFGLLVDQLDEDDRVSIVVYAGASGVVLELTPGNQKDKIMSAIRELSPGGSTAGAQGIELAYHLAQQSFVKGGINRVILATDGDFNVGVTSDGALERLIENKRKSGVYLTVLGFGTGNLKDSKME
ncbi:MAG: von Willebrand factor type A domain-containing protein, partial [Deltaproteobacteria bacterium]|nr:von Willebrand factor type A domain-containing protein [Deltaproteobacteria bacterium]